MPSKLLVIPLSQILCFMPNMITGFRLVLNYIAVLLFSTNPQLSCLVLMLSVVLDYVDGYIARMYNQCSFFGDVFDWIVDISSSAVVYFWWGSLEPEAIFVTLTLLMMEIACMVIDIVAKSHSFAPVVQDRDWMTLILKFTMQCGRRGANYVGLGYYNQILHYLCLLARVLFLRTGIVSWNCLFFLTLPASLSYVWMNIAYAKNIANHWYETQHSKKSHVLFVEEK